MVNREEAFKLYDEGVTLQKIGDRFGVTKQRIWQVIKRDYGKIKNGRQSKASSIKPNPAEKYVYNKLSKLYKNSKIELQKLNSHFDILFREKKIEVKYRSSAKMIAGRYYYQFSNIKSIEKVDFYILVVGNLDSPICYIIPGGEIKNHTNLPVDPVFKTKTQRKYKEKWSKYFGY